jgi:hypothetical protein
VNVHRVNSYETALVDDSQILRCRLERACDRRDREPPVSPDWGAAMGEIDDRPTRPMERDPAAA